MTRRVATQRHPRNEDNKLALFIRHDAASSVVDAGEERVVDLDPTLVRGRLFVHVLRRHTLRRHCRAFAREMTYACVCEIRRVQHTSRSAAFTFLEANTTDVVFGRFVVAWVVVGRAKLNEMTGLIASPTNVATHKTSNVSTTTAHQPHHSTTSDVRIFARLAARGEGLVARRKTDGRRRLADHARHLTIDIDMSMTNERPTSEAAICVPNEFGRRRWRRRRAPRIARAADRFGALAQCCSATPSIAQS
jgi:hypothetical protein